MVKRIKEPSLQMVKNLLFQFVTCFLLLQVIDRLKSLFCIFLMKENQQIISKLKRSSNIQVSSDERAVSLKKHFQII